MSKRINSASRRSLVDVLHEDGADASAIYESGMHRSMVWRFATGRRRPDPDTIARLHHLTNGRVAADGWLEDHEDEPREPPPLLAARFVKAFEAAPASGTHG